MWACVYLLAFLVQNLIYRLLADSSLDQAGTHHELFLYEVAGLVLEVAVLLKCRYE